MHKKSVENIIEMKNISMVFGKFKANDNINLFVKKNEIHAIIGENGAGKSTLMSILFGLYQPSSGSITIDGKKVIIRSPLEATRLKIGMVHQHFKLVDTFSIIDNVILNDEKSKWGFIDRKEAREKLEALMKKYHFEVDLDKKIANASVAEQQRTEILKILFRDSEILIFDEPSAVLTPQQIDEFLKAVINLKNLGKTIIIITHKLDELKKVADRGTILRRGKVIDVVDIKKTSKTQIAELMVGKMASEFLIKKVKHSNVSKEPLLIIKNLDVRSLALKHIMALKNFSLTVHAREIVAIAGIEGNGQIELINAITGLQHISKGEIYFTKSSIKEQIKAEEEIDHLKYQIKALQSQTDADHKIKQINKLETTLKNYQRSLNKPTNISMTHASIKSHYIHGMSHVPQDRHKYGLILDMTIWENVIIQDYWKRQYSRFGFLKFNNIKESAKQIVEKFDVRATYGIESIARFMSGGNQQKLVIGRELSKENADILIVAQPTRGLDVGAINQIHQNILKARNQNKAIVLISYELDEILALADRVVVLNNGKMIDDLSIKDVTKEKLGLLMTKKIPVKGKETYESN